SAGPTAGIGVRPSGADPASGRSPPAGPDATGASSEREEEKGRREHGGLARAVVVVRVMAVGDALPGAVPVAVAVRVALAAAVAAVLVVAVAVAMAVAVAVVMAVAVAVVLGVSLLVVGRVAA